MDTRPAPLTARERLVAAAIVVVGLFTSFWRLGSSGLLPDEVVYLRAGAALMDGAGDPNLEHPPLGKFLFGTAQDLAVEGAGAGRVVAAVASMAIGVLLFVLLRRLADVTTALVGAGLWAALPHAGGSSGPLAQAGRLDRFAMLDPIATAFAFGALVAGFSWLRRPRWQAAAVTGLLGGLAAGAKPTGVLVLPAVALVVLWAHRDRWPRSGAAVAIAVLTSLVGLALAYLPLGVDGLDGLRSLIEFQSQHATDGHVVTVAGTTTAFPPWWSHAWFHLRDDGIVLTLVLLGSVVAAPVSVRDAPVRTRQGVALLMAAFAVPFAALAASPVKLPFYRYAWWPQLVALLAIALVATLRGVFRESTGDAPSRWSAGGVTAGAIVLVLAGTSVVHLVRVATIGPDGYQLTAARTVDTSGFVVEGIEPMLLRGRPSILDFTTEAYADAVIDRTTELDEAASVLLDPQITSRFPHPADAIVVDASWECEPFAELTLCLRSSP